MRAKCQHNKKKSFSIFFCQDVFLIICMEGATILQTNWLVASLTGLIYVWDLCVFVCILYNCFLYTRKVYFLVWPDCKNSVPVLSHCILDIFLMVVCKWEVQHLINVMLWHHDRVVTSGKWYLYKWYDMLTTTLIYMKIQFLHRVQNFLRGSFYLTCKTRNFISCTGL